MNATALKIMLVDDNAGDIELIRKTLEETKLQLSIVTASDGQQALEQLEGILKRNESLPDLIMLDLNMPRLDGAGLLAKLNEREELKTILTVVLTSSEAERDVVKSYKLGANCYVSKPVGLDEFQKIVWAVESFWLTTAKLP